MEVSEVEEEDTNAKDLWEYLHFCVHHLPWRVFVLLLSYGGGGWGLHYSLFLYSLSSGTEKSIVFPRKKLSPLQAYLYSSVIKKTWHLRGVYRQNLTCLRCLLTIVHQFPCSISLLYFNTTGSLCLV